MKTKTFLFSVMIVSASLAQAQQPSGQSAKPSGQGASQSGQTAGQRQNPTSQSGYNEAARVGQNGQNQNVQQNGQNQNGQQNQSGAGVQGQSQTGVNGGTNNITINGTNRYIARRVGTNQVTDLDHRRELLGNERRPNFGTTNTAGFGTTNRGFGTTNNVRFGGTNRFEGNRGTAFATNGGPSVINDPSGSSTDQRGFAPTVTNRNPKADRKQEGDRAREGTQVNENDQVFEQRLGAALANPGATMIYFPQTRSNISVQNRDGTVTLTGMVRSEQEKKDIEKRIRTSRGINTVDNQLKVLGNGLKPDEDSNPNGDQRLRNP